jgi:hypothetical protein
MKINILPHVLVTNTAGSGLDERVYLLLITPPVITHNHSAIAISTLYNSLLHTHTHTHQSSSGNAIKTQNYNSLTELHIPNITHEVFSSQPHSCNKLVTTLYCTALHSALI